MRSKISFSAEIYGAINPRDKILRNRISKMRNTEFYGLRPKILKFSRQALQIKFYGMAATEFCFKILCCQTRAKFQGLEFTLRNSAQ